MSEFIKANSVDSDGASSHQVSPGYVLTFVRWRVRDSLNTTDATFGPQSVRDPLVVYNDAVQVSVNMGKASKNPTFSAALVSGDINYSTAVHPGDFVLVNMLNWEKDAERVAIKARNRQPINEVKDGFKGIFKIQNVTRQLQVAPNGIKHYSYHITGIGFSEFDNVVLFNPLIKSAFKEDGSALFQTLVGDYYSSLLKGDYNVETLVSDLFEILIGKSIASNNLKVQQYGSKHFKIPQLVGSLLGEPNAIYVNDIYNLITGIWPDRMSGTSAMFEKFNPVTTNKKSPNIYNTGIKLEGEKRISAENWNQKTVWSIMNDNLNSVINEMYTCFRIHPKINKVMPTIIARQKPFNNPGFELSGGQRGSYFLDLPRWKLNPDMVFNAQFSKSESLRFNFVQVYGRTLAPNPADDMAAQISLGNYIFDEDDIVRHGVKPYITNSNFDFPKDGVQQIRAPDWARLVADWVMNNHLKESGSIQCVGIEDPICVGDNIEFDNMVYHIEAYTHTFQIDRAGYKRFTTNLSVNYGIDKRSDKNQLVFSEMQYTDRYTKGVEDYEHNKILPGFGEAQDVISRRSSLGEETIKTKEASFILPRKPRRKEE
jgi:hypothetical protein